MRLLIVAALPLVALSLAAPAGAQAALSPPAYNELRADVIVARNTKVEVGGGRVFPLGSYVRLSLDAAVGAPFSSDAPYVSARADAVGRFLLDPFREIPVALSLGGGVSVPYPPPGSPVRPYLTLVADVEGRMHGAWTPALQLGLGGGARIGVVLRRSTPRWR
jgi:hypothetical protein